MRFSSPLAVVIIMLSLRAARSFIIPTKQTSRSLRRFFATIDIYNEQDYLKINEKDLENTISKIRSILGYPTHSVQLILCNDKYMQERNLQTRGIDEPTDILSFPFLDSIKPGVLVKPQFEIPDLYNLGDCIVDVPYVIRRCQEDRDYYEGEGSSEKEDSESNDESSDEEYDDDDRGVSGAMATVYDPEKRIHMLMVHGMLHLVGYDHIEDDDYELMVTREEEILKELGMMEERLGK